MGFERAMPDGLYTVTTHSIVMLQIRQSRMKTNHFSELTSIVVKYASIHFADY